MNETVATTGAESPTRKGLHRLFHTSKLDFYFSGVMAVALFSLAGFKTLGPCQWFPSLSAGDATTIALLFLIFGVLADIHYRTFEAQYDK